MPRTQDLRSKMRSKACFGGNRNYSRKPDVNTQRTKQAAQCLVPTGFRRNRMLNNKNILLRLYNFISNVFIIKLCIEVFQQKKTERFFQSKILFFNPCLKIKTNTIDSVCIKGKVMFKKLYFININIRFLQGRANSP